MSNHSIHEARLPATIAQAQGRHGAAALVSYRRSEAERLRSADLERLTRPLGAATALDVGARDGHFSRLLAGHVDAVTALDLEVPRFFHPKVRCIRGDVTRLALADASFDLVVCTEVLEHIPPARLGAACAELARVSRRHLLIGVPYRQDTRVGRTTCGACGAHNPPWGHVNRFDEPRLRSLFPGLTFQEVSFVGRSTESSNPVSAFLLDLAGNPYGTYGQDEPCIACGAAIAAPARRGLVRKLLTRAGCLARSATEPWRAAHPNWIHCLLRKGGV